MGEKVRQGAPNMGAAFFFWEKIAFSDIALLGRRGFASAEATRGQWKRTKSAIAPLTPSGSPLMLLDFLCCFIYSHVPFFLQDEKIAFSGAFILFPDKNAPRCAANFSFWLT
ncbi:MAG: hypothetical protein EGP83_15220 [Clostridiales bacterium]|nr:hypothetical protein [Clostridiales bacterium]